MKYEKNEFPVLVNPKLNKTVTANENYQIKDKPKL